MAANINSETGIRYGVISGNTVPYLLEDIITSGDDLTYAGQQKELKRQIQTALESALDDILQEYSCWDAERRKLVIEDCGMIDVADSCLGSLNDAGLNDDCGDDGKNEYELHDSDGSIYRLGYLGGAPLIWTIESNYVTHARHCSPCVPNAGDLDNPTDADNGFECYCPPPDCFATHDESYGLYVISQSDPDDRGLITLVLGEKPAPVDPDDLEEDAETIAE